MSIETFSKKQNTNQQTHNLLYNIKHANTLVVHMETIELIYIYYLVTHTYTQVNQPK